MRYAQARKLNEKCLEELIQPVVLDQGLNSTKDSLSEDVGQPA